MKQCYALRPAGMCMVLCLIAGTPAFGQGFGLPLTIQGMNHLTPQSAASRGMGGTIFGVSDDIGVMFANPASLQSLRRLQVSFGGAYQNVKTQQTQQYAPLKYYSNFSLLMEGLTGYIPDPDTTRPSGTPGDTVYRPLDDIGPNWSRSRNNTLPVQALAGIPFSVAEMDWSVGLGYIEYADLRHHYQNNNVLSPSILSQRPSAIPLPTNILPLRTEWSQYLQTRDGSIRGYGIALAGSLSEEIAVGVSGLLLKGSSDDYEQYIGRGRLTFFANYFRLDTLRARATGTGTSEYSGQEFTVSATYHGQSVTAGFAVKPPTSIKREFTTRVSMVDTAGISSETTIAGQDELRFPWRGSVGLSIAVREDVRIGLEYELRPYASARYTSADGSTSHPWLSSSVFRTGIEYAANDWLSVRAGIRGQSEVFEPEGNPIEGEVAGYSIYSGGVGLRFAGARLNLAYEYALLKYQDIYGANVNLNSDKRHTIVADIVYELPW